MPFEKGKLKTGGRKKGTLNRANSFQADKIHEMCNRYEIDPIEALLKLASDESLDLQSRISIFKELAQYVYPKRKSIEIDAGIEINTAPQIQIYLPDNGTCKN